MDSFQVTIATSFWQRLRGLIGRAPLRATEAMFIPDCRQVHTFFMSYPIDVVFIDADRRVLEVVAGLKPWRWSPVVASAVGCFEFRAGIIDCAKLLPGTSVENLLTLPKIL